jgi:hypothetical protein
MSWPLKISSVRTAGPRSIRRQRSPRPRRMYPFLLHRNRPAAPQSHRNKPQEYNARGPDGIPFSQAVWDY